MRLKEKWDAWVQTMCYATHSRDVFTIHGVLDRDPERYLNINIQAKDKQTARWLAKALLEWAGEESE